MELEHHIDKFFSINEESGIITREDRKNSNGSLDKDGYLIYKIKGKQIKSHRLAWYLYYGEYPIGEIDHINRVRTDNRKENLRSVTRYENYMNRRIPVNKDTGIRGVHLDRCTKGLKKKYTTKIGKKTFRFYTLEQAERFRNNHTQF